MPDMTNPTSDSAPDNDTRLVETLEAGLNTANSSTPLNSSENQRNQHGTFFQRPTDDEITVAHMQGWLYRNFRMLANASSTFCYVICATFVFIIIGGYLCMNATCAKESLTKPLFCEPKRFGF